MRKYLFILIVLLPLCGMAGEQSNSTTQLILLYPSGKELSTDLAAIGKLSFASDSVYLISNKGETIGKEACGKIQHIRFADKNHSALIDSQTIGVSIYPNPTAEMLTINGIMRETTVRIYSTNGKLQMTENISSTNNTLSVASLSKGIYLLQINTEVIRIIKK